MVRTQLADRGIRSPAVLQAMRDVPRELFVGEAQRALAYRDAPLPIGLGQTISQPYIVALMIESAQVGPGDAVLEVGAGSGYAAAVLGRLARTVLAIERHPVLAAAARERLAALGCRNVEVVAGDGTRAVAGGARFDVILVAAGGPDVPASLKAQLNVGGRLVMPVGSRHHQQLVKVTHTASGAYDQALVAHVAFVPLIGEQGWSDTGPPQTGLQEGDR